MATAPAGGDNDVPTENSNKVCGLLDSSIPSTLDRLGGRFIHIDQNDGPDENSGKSRTRKPRISSRAAEADVIEAADRGGPNRGRFLRGSSIQSRTQDVSSDVGMGLPSQHNI